jgi:hypothetical protein
VRSKRLFEAALVIILENIIAILEQPLHLRVLFGYELDNERLAKLPKKIGDGRQGHIV